MLDGLVQGITQTPCKHGVRIISERVARDEIWTYDRVPGTRILIPWEVDGIPDGHLQMDLVFGEKLPRDPVKTVFRTVDGGEVMVWTADKELSLAWKLFWLATDIHPQGKDLYDAVLLAENVTVSMKLLGDVFGDTTRADSDENLIDFDERFETAWNHFAAEYPWITGNARDFHRRLMDAIRPTFSNSKETDPRE